MCARGPVTAGLRQNLDRCLEEIRNGSDVNDVFVDFASYIVDAVEQLEAQVSGRVDVGLHKVVDFPQVSDGVMEARDFFEDEGVDLLNLRLDESWKSLRAHGDLPNLFKTRVPFIKRTQAKWDAHPGLVHELARVLDLPPLDYVDDAYGQPLRARLVRRTSDPERIYVTFGGYVLTEIAKSNRRWACILMDREDAFCVEVAASFHWRGNRWQMAYYL